MIIDDDFLLSQYPTSINWNLDLLGKNGTENKTAYKKFEKEIIEDVVSTRIPSSWTRKDIWG